MRMLRLCGAEKLRLRSGVRTHDRFEGRGDGLLEERSGDKSGEFRRRRECRLVIGDKRTIADRASAASARNWASIPVGQWAHQGEAEDRRRPGWG